MHKFTLTLLALSLLNVSHAQTKETNIPLQIKEVKLDANNQMVLQKNKQTLKLLPKADRFTLSQMNGQPEGTAEGIALNFKDSTLNGSIAYGPINANDKYPVVAFLPKTVKIAKGKSVLELKKSVKGPNDFYKISDTGFGVIAYRVMDVDGRIIYEGRVAFEGKGPYTVQTSITEGPLINVVTDKSAVVSFETSNAKQTHVRINGKTIFCDTTQRRQEIALKDLNANQTYTYELVYGKQSEIHAFKTAPSPGTRSAFSFAIAGANRATTGGGERDFGGTNFQTTRSIMALSNREHIAFMQATGDITNGGNSSLEGHLLEYANFKRALDPFWSSIPVYTGFGDHEVNYFTFDVDTLTKKGTKIARFPYNEVSGEKGFADAFVHPTNGPDSEDETSFDPQKGIQNFPPYSENVYYYTYDNVAMIVLNTEYWKAQDPLVSGSPEGYIMDKQLAWLEKTMSTLENDPSIDHIFVNVHSAVFPNGDHANGAMWYNGSNVERPKMGAERTQQGILERRDAILECCVNKSKKFLAFLSADEHNFAYLEINSTFPLYPDNYKLPKIKLNRPFYHINNGGGGSAPYAKLETPWSNRFATFSAPPVVVFLEVQGQKVSLKAVNAETLEVLCENIPLKK
jgi:hypothetical protein